MSQFFVFNSRSLTSLNIFSFQNPATTWGLVSNLLSPGNFCLRFTATVEEIYTPSIEALQKGFSLVICDIFIYTLS